MGEIAPADRLDTLPPGIPELTLGWIAIEWASTWLVHPNGPRAGKLWEYTERQVRFVLWHYALRPDTRWVYQHSVRRLSKGAGKALALDTVLPAPLGRWTAMGLVRPGDELLDETGSPCTVLAVSEVMTGRDCYRVTFDDGTQITADAEHLWPFLDLERGYSRALSTRQALEAGIARWRTLETPYGPPQALAAIEPVESVPVRCVTVSSPSSLYLAGDGMIPTHNSPSAAVLGLTELLAPVRFDHFDPNLPGGVAGKPVDMPLVQVAGVSESATANTMRHIRAMTAKTSKVVREYNLDPGKTVIYTPNGGQLEAITSSAAAAEGAEVTAALCDEPEHWKPANGGVDLAAVIDRNLAKSSSRAIETANAWEPGAGSVAEATFDAWVAQEEGRTKSGALILYDALVAPPETDLADEASLRAGIAAAYGDSFWVDQEIIRDRILSLRTKPDVARRFYLNQPVASQDAWVTPQEWAALADATQIVADGDEIVAFFDGSRTRDATALLGCHVETGYVFTLGVWEPPPGPSHNPGETWAVPVDQVDAAVERMFGRWDVRAFFADVREWESFTKTTWPERYGDLLELHAVPHGREPQVIAWDMRTRVYDFTMACELTLTEIVEEKAFRHDGDSRTGRHVVNARRHPNRHGVSIGKESRDSPKKIDAAVCVIGARMARRLLLAKRAAEPQKTPRSGKVWGFA